MYEYEQIVVCLLTARISHSDVFCVSLNRADQSQ
jgi:hypothetical protein